MREPKENPVAVKSFSLAVRVVRLYQHLRRKFDEPILFRQLLRSGTSVGANVEEAIGGQSTADFLSKLRIARKEGRETSYWVRLLHATDYLEDKEFASIHDDNEEVLRLLTSIIVTTENNNRKTKSE